MTPMKTLTVPSLYSDSLYYLTGELARQVEKMAKEAFKPSGLHPSHAFLLQLIIDSRFPFPTLFAKYLRLSPSTISRMLQKLEEKGLIACHKYHQMSLVEATEKGRELWPMLLECENSFTDRCEKLLGARESYRLASIIKETTGKLAENCLATDGKSGPE